MKKLVGLAMLLSVVASKAQELIPYDEMMASRPVSQYTIKEWNMDNGLPNNAILDIEQTSDGYLWLATFNGLTRFDGIEFMVYNRSITKEFITNHISALVVDDNDKLWIGTNGGGLLAYHQGVFTAYETKSVDGSIITALAKGENGSLWVGTRNGLVKFEDGDFQAINNPELSNLNITSLFYDGERLWVGTTTKGLFAVDDNGAANFSSNHGLRSDFVYSVFADSKERIWVGTDRGVSLVSSEGIKSLDSFSNAPAGYVNDFLEDQQGNVWLATRDGLYRFGDSFEKADPGREIGHHIVQSLFQDREKNIWAGTYRVGLSRLNQSKFLLIGDPEGIENEIINVTYTDGARHWVGTDNGLIRMQDGKMTAFNVDSQAGGNRIRDILRDSQGRLWLCTYNGLIQFKEGKVIKKYTTRDGLSSNNTRRIVEDHQGNLWIGTANGLSKLNEDGFYLLGTQSGLRDNYILSMFVDNAGRLWVGTNGGGTYQLEDGHFKQILSEQAAHDIVFNFTQDKDNSIWISTNRGVIYYKDNLEFNISVQHGLASNNIFQVILDQTGLVWFATDHGIMRANREEVDRLISGEASELSNTRIFDTSDGLRTGQITPASITSRTRDGEIWFCTIKGVAVLDSDRIPTNELRANTLLNKIITDDRVYSGYEHPVLSAGNRRLELHYSGLSFSAPEKVRYKFKLEKFDHDWVDAGSRRVAYYTNLPPGEYEFKVMAANNDGLWSEIPATMHLVQSAYFYQETWFYLVLGVLLMAFGAFLYYLRAQGLSRRNFQLARMVQERTRDIQYQNEEIILQKEELKQLNRIKDKLLSVLSHDLRGPISAVSGLLGLLKSGHLNYHELITQSKRLNSEVHNLTYLLDNLLSWSKTQMQGIKLNSETVQLRHIVEENLVLVKPISEQKRISIFNQVPANCYVHTDLNFFSLIIRNLLMNALKFTNEKGEIIITSEYQDPDVVVAVNDNGVGMSAEELEKLFKAETHYSKMGTANEAGTGIGLLLCKEFIELEGGRIWAESKKGKGSSFKIQLKRGKAESVGARQA